MSDDSTLDVVDLSLTLGHLKILDAVSLSVRAGEIVASPAKVGRVNR